MKTEFEAKFLGVDVEKLRSQLQAVGYECVQPERLMRRHMFAFPGVSITDHYARVRDEGHRVTTTVKKVAAENDIARVSESEIVVNDFDDACAFLKACGCEVASYQETKREEWRHGQIEACIDTWPGLKAFVEIEGPSEDAVKNAAVELGFDYAEAVFGAVGEVYVKEMGYTHAEVMALEVITFEVVPPRKS